MISLKPIPLTKSITRPINHCIIKAPKKINKLNDVSALPARWLRKDNPTAGCITVKKTEVRINNVI